MASDFKIDTDTRNTAANAIVDELDGGTPPATISIYTGSPPANITDASTGTLLATLTFSNPAFGNAGASNPGEAIANAITSDSSADNSGDAGYFRIRQGGAADTANKWQGTAGEAADTPDLVFDDKAIVAGGVVAITSLNLTVPEQ